MQDLKTLNSLELHTQTIAAATAEKQATLHLLTCLHLVEERKVYLERGYSTLFNYVTGALGYSEAQASERIRAMRLVFAVPEVAQSLHVGALTLTSVAKIATHAKNEGLLPEQVAALLPRVEHCSVRQVERVLAELAPQVALKTRVRTLSAELSELRVTLDSETLALIEEARDLDSDPGVRVAALLKKALRQYVQKKHTDKAAALKRPGQNRVTLLRSTEVDESYASELPPASRYIPRPLRRQIWQRAQGKCEYVDSQTGKRCADTRALTYEHRRPFAWGGSHTRENLALFCTAHNQHAGERFFGTRKAKN